MALCVMGLAYKVPLVRTKEWPYLDVLSESANNAVRLLLGWFALVTTTVPPLSLTISYWMLGAFFMATKRFAEYRDFADPLIAARYRRSFRHYTADRLLVSIMFYATACAMFAGVFIVRYHLELILFVPLAAALFAYYLTLGLQPNSPTQHPEKLYRDRGFFIYVLISPWSSLSCCSLTSPCSIHGSTSRIRLPAPSGRLAMASAINYPASSLSS